jgi:SRSO17 transposase
MEVSHGDLLPSPTDERRRSLLAHLGEAHAVLVSEDTGVLKKGQDSAGVARQYSGTAGRIDHCQLGVFLADASRHGHTRLDRELSRPKAWTDAPGRGRQAGIPAARPCATKPPLAKAMRQRTLAAGIAARWVTGDCVDGNEQNPSGRPS